MRPEQEVSDKTTEVGTGRCTIKQVPEKEEEKKKWHETKGRVVGGTPKATYA